VLWLISVCILVSGALCIRLVINGVGDRLVSLYILVSALSSAIGTREVG
jgi:hypothetical protein